MKSLKIKEKKYNKLTNNKVNKISDNNNEGSANNDKIKYNK